MSIELCEWDYAIEKGGFYFSRAKYLGLPKPPKCFVDNDDFDLLTAEEQNAIAAYHQLFDNAEIEAAMKITENEI